MDIYQTLHNEHKQVAKMFSDIDETSSDAISARDRLFNELKTALELHSRSEEMVFYPLLEKNEESHFLALEAAEEHHVLHLLLDELASMPKDKEKWLAKISVLKEMVMHHVDEEETELFSKARDLMNEEQAENMAVRFEEHKRKLH